MALRVIQPGILNTIQDLGRYGMQSIGVNPNGVMDRAAALLANLLLANDEYGPVIELHFPAGRFRFEKPAIFTLAGADFAAELDGAPLENWRMLEARTGSVLRFRQKRFGMRCYLAIKGGLDCDRWLGSASTNLNLGIGGFNGRRLHKNDCIVFKESSPSSPSRLGLRVSGSLLPRYSSFPTVRFTPGAEFEEIDLAAMQDFLNSPFTVSMDSNRMGYRLEGPPLKRQRDGEILSSAVTFGTIQLLPSGQLIVLMSDHQTTGGYPRVGNVISLDLPLLAQLGPNDRLFFKQVSIHDAELLTANYKKELALFRHACRFL